MKDNKDSKAVFSEIDVSRDFFWRVKESAAKNKQSVKKWLGDAVREKLEREIQKPVSK